MKDQIKIQVSDDGLFGTPVSPYQIDPDKTYPLMGGDNILRAKEAFAASHPTLPLTTPQIPKSVVMGEVVWQTKHYSGDTWYESPNMVFVNDDNEIVSASVKDTRQAYKVITPVPNSEPKPFPETIEQVTEWEARNKVIGNPDINFPVEEMVIDLQKRMGNSEPKETVTMKTAKEILDTYHPIKHDTRLKTDLWPESTVLRAMEEYSAQQQPVSKSEGNKIYFETEYQLQEFRNIEREHFDKDGNAYKLHTSTHLCETMLKLINQLETELKTTKS